MIQSAADEASHAHSGSVVTLKVPTPPAASTVGAVFSVNEHFARLGLVMVTDDDVSQSTVKRAMIGTLARRILRAMTYPEQIVEPQQLG